MIDIELIDQKSDIFDMNDYYISNILDLIDES